MVTKIRATKKRNSKVQDPNRNRVISIEEIESFGATEVKRAYIDEFKGCIHYKNTKAKGVIKFMEAENSPDQLRAMANFIACSYCDEEGKLIYSSEDDVMGSLTRVSIHAISLGIAQAWQAEEESEGNA